MEGGESTGYLVGFADAYYLSDIERPRDIAYWLIYLFIVSFSLY